MTAPGPYEAGETGRVYQIAHELFAENLSMVTNLFLHHPHLQATSVTVKNGRVEIVADGIHGVLKEWARALPEHTADVALYSNHNGVGLEDVLHAGHTTVHVRR
ncbi:hypothetical protein, partial [Streptomyces sp.]|uniref:hypothetical protein n=1 Tax=Streptomyces sp. TaxID=1931 RepID=UPI002F93C1CE